MTTPSSLKYETRRVLLVIGAALGNGRWLAENILANDRWDSVYLVDSDRALTSLQELNWSFQSEVYFGLSEEVGTHIRFMAEVTTNGVDSLVPLVIDAQTVIVCVAVPPRALMPIMEAVKSLVPHADAILVVAVGMIKALSAVRRAGVGMDVVTGVHVLNESTSHSALGQTIYLVCAGQTDNWLPDLVRRSGAVPRIGTAYAHDRTMAVVQGLTHRLLIAFADTVAASGLSIEDDLWPSRTPLFESTLALSAHVLDPRQQTMTCVIEEALSSAAHVTYLGDSLTKVAVSQPDITETIEWIGGVRSPFAGTFFESLRSSAAASVEHIQHKRAELARHRIEKSLVGLLHLGTKDQVYVGQVLHNALDSVWIEELLVGPPGRAALLFGDGIENSRRLGVARRTKKSELALHNLVILSDVELDEILTQRLGFIVRDVRFLVPESVSGVGVRQAVSEMKFVRDAYLVDEVVRTGQRSVVIRFGIRSDRSVRSTIEEVKDHVGSIYQWPVGSIRQIITPSPRIVYLGPVGTFSETAACRLAENMRGSGAAIVDVPAFADVIRSVTNGAIGVIPLCSSASGLVTRSVQALLDAQASVVAGGVIDVAVRFDAYTQVGLVNKLEPGANVYSHPQGLAQCRDFVRRMRLEVIEVSSTARALELVASSAVPAVALAGPEKGIEYGLRVLEREIDDLSGSITRFLVLGRDDTFGDLEGGSAPTLRTVWVGANVADILPLIGHGGSGYDELMTDTFGHFSLITSRDLSAVASSGTARNLGSMPWSPRTPIVRPGSH